MNKIGNIVAMYDAVARTAYLRSIDLYNTDLQRLLDEWYNQINNYLRETGRYNEIGEYLKKYLNDMTIPASYKVNFVLNREGDKLCKRVMNVEDCLPLLLV